MDINFIDRIKFNFILGYSFYNKNMTLFYQHNHCKDYIGKYKPLDKKIVDFEKYIIENIDTPLYK